MSPKALARRIKSLRPIGPLTTRFERATRRTDRKVWYRTQKEHWLGWLEGYSGPGAYGRSNWDRSAEFVYNHVNCAPMLLWLAEASGVRRDLLRRAWRAAVGAGPSYPSQCGAIRLVLPWTVIEPALLQATSN